MNKASFFLLILLPFVLSSQSLQVYDLKTEQLVNPLGLDLTNPRFSWKLQSNQKNTTQTSYEITIASSPDFNKKNMIWTSKQSTDQSIYIPYEGPALKSNTRYYWKLTVWDNHGNMAMSGTPAFWHTGFLSNGEWKAKWIGAESVPAQNGQYPSPVLRKEFTLAKDVKSATLFISSHGLYEAQINGTKVGNDYLTPGWTSYKKRIQYQVYDVTYMIKKGKNAIGAMLGKGWYKGSLAWENNRNLFGDQLALIAQLMVTLSDGSTQIINSDDSWSYNFGPIRDAEIYHGEYYDSRFNIPGWSITNFDASSWAKAKIMDNDVSPLIGAYSTPVRKHEIIKPIQLIITPQKDTVLDFGQNMVGWVKLKASGPKGTIIRIQHAEVLDKFGNFYTENLRAARQMNTYILNGSGEESFEPHFTFQGWRYIKVSGYPGPVTLDKFEGITLYSDMDRVGTFECSNPLINQLQHNIQWGQRGNFVDVPTDCPQRDERLGWTGDAQAFSRTAAYNFNVQNFFGKWLQDVSADQAPDGMVPHVVPNVLGPKAGASTGWADVSNIIPWNMFMIYGDTAFLQRQYPSMKKWVQYMVDSSRDDLWNHGFHFGDWLFYSVNDDRDGRSAVTDKYLIAQCFFANSTQIMINAANVLGNKEDVKYYTSLLFKIKNAFRREYVTASGRMTSNTQTAYVLALQFDMLLPEQKEYAAKLLVDNIKSYNNHITTGFLGTPYICHVLSNNGYPDIAYKLLLQETYPSWLYPVRMGATTIWERWDGIKPDSTFQSASMNSFNHYAYGAIGDWMYRVVCGIEIAQEGYKQSIIAPVLTPDLKYASSSTITPYGLIKSGWNQTTNVIDYTIEIPANTTCILRLPGDESKITTSDIKLDANNTMKTDKGVDIKLGSGSYSFRVMK